MAASQNVLPQPRTDQLVKILRSLNPNWEGSLDTAARAAFNKLYQELSRLDDRDLDRRGRRGE